VVDRKALKSAAEKLARGAALTGSEKKAHAQWERDTEAKWRDKIYRDVPIKDVARLMVGRTPRFVRSFAQSTGLPLGGDTSDLFAVFSALVEFAAKVPVETPLVAGASEKLICTTMFSAAEALKARIGRGSVRMLRDWMKAGMPGTAGARGKPGHLPIDEMVAWAKDNLDDLKAEADEGSLLNMELKRQKVRQQTLTTEEMEQSRDERRGNILPRDEFTQFLTDAIALARTQLLDVPNRLADLISDHKLQRTVLAEATPIIEEILNGLAEAFASGPEVAVRTADAA